MIRPSEIYFLIGVIVGAAGMFGIMSTAHGQTWSGEFTTNSRSIFGPPGTSITATPAPKCEEGWTLVLDSAMRPMCTRELRKPQ